MSDGKTAWTAPFPGADAAAAGRAALDRVAFSSGLFGQLAQADPAAPDPERRRRPGGPGGPGGRRGGMGGRGGGYGSIVDAGPVLFALTPAAQLIVFEPTDKEFRQLASYKVAEGPTHAYPVASGSRIFIKDNDSLTLWTVD